MRESDSLQCKKPGPLGQASVRIIFGKWKRRTYGRGGKIEKRKKENENEHIAGILFLTSDIAGTLQSPESITGNGSFKITDGHIWQWNILSGISKILLIPEFKTLVFTDAHGDFKIADKHIITENTKLIGNAAALSAKGWIDFEKNLNFDITPTFSELAILQSESLKKRATSILTQTEGYLNIKLTGTLDNPQHRVEKFPIKIIEETLGTTTKTLKEVIGSVIGEIF